LFPIPRPAQTDTEELAVVFERALRCDIERTIRPACMQANHAARTDGMAGAEFVKDIRVED
jgi:hypothetical protein